jgi:hypothetical protein
MTENPFKPLNDFADQLANMRWGQFVTLCAYLAALVMFHEWLVR